MTNRALCAICVIVAAAIFGIGYYLYKRSKAAKQIKRLITRFSGKTSPPEAITRLKTIRQLMMRYQLSLPNKLTMDQLVQLAKASCERGFDSWCASPEEKAIAQKELIDLTLEFLSDKEDQIVAAIHTLAPTPASVKQ